MTKDPRKREQEKARKAKKERERALEYARSRKGAVLTSRSASPSTRIADAAEKPLHECRVSGTIFQSGMGKVHISRHMPGGNLAVSVFLVDTYCLGIKDAFYRVVTKTEYETRMLSDGLGGKLDRVEASHARKLVESAYAYASSLGVPQSPEYHACLQLFGDVSADDCHEKFEFGLNGAPLYIAGPNDSPAFQARIIKCLSNPPGSGASERLLPFE